MLPSHPTPPRCCPSCTAGALCASDTASLLPSAALSATTLLCLHESNSSGDLTEVDHAAFVSCSLSHLEQCLQGSAQGWPVSERLSFLRLGCHRCVDGPHEDVDHTEMFSLSSAHGHLCFFHLSAVVGSAARRSETSAGGNGRLLYSGGGSLGEGRLLSQNPLWRECSAMRVSKGREGSDLS